MAMPLLSYADGASECDRFTVDLPDGAADMNDRLVAEAEAGETPAGAQVTHPPLHCKLLQLVRLIRLVGLFR